MLFRSILLLSFGAMTAAAQTITTQSTTPPWAPPRGTHIRGYVLRPDSAAVDGWVLRYDGAVAALSVCTSCTVSANVPIDSVFGLEEALEEAHERARYPGGELLPHLGKSIAVGAGVGVGVGASILALGVGGCGGEGCDLTPLVVTAGAVLGGGVGLFVGLVSGIIAADEFWTPVPRPWAQRLGLDSSVILRERRSLRMTPRQQVLRSVGVHVSSSSRFLIRATCQLMLINRTMTTISTRSMRKSWSCMALRWRQGTITMGALQVSSTPPIVRPFSTVLPSPGTISASGRR